MGKKNKIFTSYGLLNVWVCLLSMSSFCCGRLRSMFVAGERCDVETLEWAKRNFDVPILDHWWQTGRTRAPCWSRSRGPRALAASSPQGLLLCFTPPR